MRLPCKEGHILRLRTALKVRRKKGIAFHLNVSPGAVAYSEKTQSVPLPWLLSLLEKYRISPAWVLGKNQTMHLRMGIELVFQQEFPWGTGLHSQLLRLKGIFPGISRPRDLFIHYPQLNNPQKTFGSTISRGKLSLPFLWLLYRHFGINPAWLSRGQSPTIYQGSSLKNFGDINHTYRLWSENEKNTDEFFHFLELGRGHGPEVAPRAPPKGSIAPIWPD